MIKINNRVKIIKQHSNKAYKDTYGKEGIVDYIDYKSYKYGVKFPDISNPQSKYGRFYFQLDEIELINNDSDNHYATLGCRTTIGASLNEVLLKDIADSKDIPTFKKISSDKIKCVIIVRNRPEAFFLERHVTWATPTNPMELFDEALKHSKNSILRFYVTDGVVYRYDTGIYRCNTDIVCGAREQGFDKVYNCSDIIKASGFTETFTETESTKTEDICINKDIFKEDKNNMNRTFLVESGKRPNFDKGNKKVKEIYTMTTTVKTFFGEASATCDLVNYDVYTGALVAAAKITANKSEEAMLIYKTAIDMWGTDMCTAILRSLANRAFGATPFDRAYKKWRKAIAYKDKMKDKKERTCYVCGRTFKTVDEARAHERWHDECKRNRAERREAKRRINEAEREGRIEDIMRELMTKKENGNNEIIE